MAARHRVAAKTVGVGIHRHAVHAVVFATVPVQVGAHAFAVGDIAPAAVVVMPGPEIIVALLARVMAKTIVMANLVAELVAD